LPELAQRVTGQPIVQEIRWVYANWGKGRAKQAGPGIDKDNHRSLCNTQQIENTPFSVTNYIKVARLIKPALHFG
jgi:hypothetical protein